MDEDLRNMIKENNVLLREAVENTQDTNVRIRKIHAIMKRTFWTRMGYWVLLLLVTAGAFYAVIPVLNSAISRYTFIDNPFGINIGNDSDDARKVLEIFSGSNEE